MRTLAFRAGAALGFGGLLALTPLTAAAQNSFTVTELALPAGNSLHPFGGYARAINATHQVVGNAYVNEYQGNGFTYISTQGALWDALHTPFSLFQLTYPDKDFATVAFDINDAGTIAGFARDSSLTSFLYYAGSYLFLEKGSSYSYVLALNNSNQSAGYVDNANKTTAAVLWDSAGKATRLNPPGGSSQANALNDAGLVVGETNTEYTDPPRQPFVWDSLLGASLLPVGGNVGGGALAVNNAGTIAGYVETQPNHDADHAALWHNGAGTDIQQFGLHSKAVDINDAGQVIGSVAIDDRNGDMPFYYAGGKMQLLLDFLDESFGYKYLTVRAIGPDGSIVGEATNNSYGFDTHPVLLTPSQTLLPHPTDAISQLTIALAPRPVYNKVSKLWERKATLTNRSTSSLSGPFNVVLDGLSRDSSYYAVLPKGGILLANTPVGTPYYRFDIPGNVLAPGASATLTVAFSLPALRTGTNFTISHVYAGPGRP